MEILQKAYNVYHKGMIGFGPEIANSILDTEVVYADNPNQAKMMASEWSNWEIEGREPKYIDLRCKRSKGNDIISFEGKNYKRHQVAWIISDRKRIEGLKQFLNDPLLSHCYIQKRGVYYRPNSNGYTEFKEFAGIYTIEEGVSHAISCRELTLIRVSKEDHNILINKTINNLKTRLL